METLLLMVNWKLILIILGLGFGFLTVLTCVVAFICWESPFKQLNLGLYLRLGLLFSLLFLIAVLFGK